jgi:hypothetical protein
MRKLTLLVGLVTIFSLALAGPALAALVMSSDRATIPTTSATVPPTVTRQCLAGAATMS